MSAGAAETLTHRRVLRIALPILLANATVPLLGAVDTGVIGQLGEAAPIGAVGLGAIVLAFLYWAFGFLRMGTTGLAAQAIGAGESREVSALLVRGLLIGGAGGLLLVLLQAPLFALAFRLSPGSDEVEALARSYLSIRIWGAPAAIASFAVSGWLIAQERTRAVLIVQVWTNGLNVGLDLWFVFGLGWGVEGVAAATLLAEWSGLGLGLFLCRDAFRGRDWRDAALILDRARLLRMAAVNADIMIRSVLLEIAFGVFVFRSAGFGDGVLAANQVLMQFLAFSAYVLDGFAFAAEALVGRAMGGRNPAALRRAAILASLWAFGLSALIALAFGLGGAEIVALMAKSEEVRAEAARFLPFVALAPLVGAPAFMLDGIFIGATRTRDMRNAVAVALALYLAALWPLVALFGAEGLWIGLLLFLGLRGVTLQLRYPALEAAARPDARAAPS